jgi:hypothetical protein
VQLCDRIDISYRQLDYMCRRGLIPGQERGVGSGRRRLFERSIVDRLDLAALIRDAMPFGSMPGSLVWTSIVEAVMAGPDPLPKGFAVLDAGGLVRYVESVRWEDVEIGALVVPYTLT